MIDADYELAARLQAQEQEELTVEEKSKLFMELMDKRKKHFAKLKAEEQRRKPPTKAQKRNQIIKKKKIDDDQEEAEMKKHIEIVVDEEEIAVDVIPLATKPPIIVDWKIIKEGKMGYFKLIRADGSSRWNTRPEEAYERVLWGDLKVMFEPNIESDIWINLQGHKVTDWNLFSSSGVHFMRFQNLHIFMLVEKKYPLTPATITTMLNKKLQTDHWNEMCYQFLKLVTKQGRIVKIKRLYDDLGVNTIKVRVTAAKHNLLFSSCMASIHPECFSATDTFLGSISERKSANRHSLVEAAVSLA
ncbi:hypothetical protein Tco_0967237 [Tanacetum coccineum]